MSLTRIYFFSSQHIEGSMQDAKRGARPRGLRARGEPAPTSSRKSQWS